MASPSNDLYPSKMGAVPLSDERDALMILQNSVLGLWEIVNNLTRLKPTRTCHYRVTIFGSARCEPGTPTYEKTRKIANALAEMGCDIITGGGPGLMQAANEGAMAAGAPEHNHSIGIRVDLPFEQGANSFVQMAFTHRTFFTRLHHFVLSSDAFIVTPGGIGTLLELTMIWQLLQVGHLKNVPLILVGSMWPSLIEWAKTNMVHGDFPMANDNDMNLPICVEHSDQAIAIIQAHREEWLKHNCEAPPSYLEPADEIFPPNGN